MAMPEPPSKKPVRDAKPTTSDFIETVIDTYGEFLDPLQSPARVDAGRSNR
jgi:hypothetical protein